VIADVDEDSDNSFAGSMSRVGSSEDNISVAPVEKCNDDHSDSVYTF
jgi:hypothetical protein